MSYKKIKCVFIMQVQTNVYTFCMAVKMVKIIYTKTQRWKEILYQGGFKFLEEKWTVQLSSRETRSFLPQRYFMSGAAMRSV